METIAQEKPEYNTSSKRAEQVIPYSNTHKQKEIWAKWVKGYGLLIEFDFAISLYTFPG